jgi:hypothetical protein
LKIPIGVKEVDDRSIGTSIELENIQFKPGYNVLRTLDEEQQATGSSNHPSTNKELWKSVWKLGVQPKIKNFRWRATRNRCLHKQICLRR